MNTGDFGVVRTGGWAGWGIRVVTRSHYNHAILHVGNGQVVEAQPRGACFTPVGVYADADIIWSNLDLADVQRAVIAKAGRARVGTPYSWVDDACIALTAIFSVHVPRWVRRRLARPDRLMCSQLVDVCYEAAGIDLVLSKVLPGDVTPGDLADVIARRPVPEHW